MVKRAKGRYRGKDGRDKMEQVNREQIFQGRESQRGRREWVNGQYEREGRGEGGEGETGEWRILMSVRGKVWGRVQMTRRGVRGKGKV